MAVAKFKAKMFDDIQALQLFVQGDASVASVISILTDASGKYILCFLTP